MYIQRCNKVWVICIPHNLPQHLCYPGCSLNIILITLKHWKDGNGMQNIFSVSCKVRCGYCNFKQTTIRHQLIVLIFFFSSCRFSPV